jgi:hypothetical protein
MAWSSRTWRASWAARLPERLRANDGILTGLCAALLCGVILAFYYRLWWPGNILIRRDVFRFYAPIKQYMADRLLAGELPEWFPYEALGRSFIGATVTGVFHPLTVLYLLVPAHDALRLIALMLCLVAGLGAFALSRALRVSRAGATVAGILFACSGYVASITDNPPYLYSTCVLPLFCVTLHRALGSHVAWSAVPAVVWASVFLYGDVQTGYYFAFIALLWLMTVGTVPVRQAWIRLLGVGALAGLLAGVQLAPAGAVFLESDRADPALFREEAMYWSTHPLELVGIVAAPLVPIGREIDAAHFFYGGQSMRGSGYGVWAISLYLGIPAVGLALSGGWYRRDLRGLVWLGVFGLLLSLGKYGGLYELCYQAVPLWSAFRYPEKLMSVVTFAIAMLAGAGVDELRKGRGHPMGWFVAALVCLMMGGLFHLEAFSRWAIGVAGIPGDLMHTVLEMAGRAFLLSALAASGTGLIALGIRLNRAVGHSAAVALVMLLVLDLAHANQEAYHTGPAAAATFVPGLAEALKRHSGVEGPGSFRILPLTSLRSAYPNAVRESLDVVGAISVADRQSLAVDHNVDFQIESLGYYLPGASKTMVEFQDALRKPRGLDVFARYNVVYAIGRPEFLSASLFARSHVAAVPDYDLALIKNPYPAKPRAYLSMRPELASSPIDYERLFKRKDFLGGAVDVIEGSLPSLPGASLGGTAEVRRYRPESVVVQVETAAPAVLILLDAFEAGWRASLEDGRELPIRRANGLVRAVAVPAGAHEVTFTYRTPLLAAGAWCSVAGLLICAGLLWRAWRNGARRVGSCGEQPQEASHRTARGVPN